MRETPRGRLFACGLAVLATGVSLLVRWPLWPVLDTRVRYMTFIPAVALSAYYGGLWPGLLATVLSAAAGTCFVAEPSPSLAITSALLHVIDDLLGFSKIEAGRLELDAVDFRLRALLEETLGVLAPRADQKGLRLVWQVQADVPDALVGDPGRLRQVLINLVGNAIKFTERGDVVVEATAEEPHAKTQRRKEEQEGKGSSPSSLGGLASLPEVLLHFTVRDTGIGIPPEKQEQIFQPFEQADNSTARRYGGTGLGLSIAARLVELMGGRIAVESAPGCGSTFRFRVRFGRQGCAPPAPPDRPREDESWPAPPAPRPLRVLLAEDNEFNQEVVLHLLGRQGHKVQVARDGREALAALDEGPFDLLLLDVHMPELDGFRVIEALRQREQGTGRHLPVIALTARAAPGDRARCLQAGMDDYLAKPLHAADLLAAIERALAGRPAPPPAADERPAALLDAATLLRACGGSAELLRKMTQSFRAVLPDHLAAVAAAVRDRDAAGLRETAHRLSGLVSTFSSAAGALARGLEQRGADGRLDAADVALAQLTDLLQQLAPRVEQLTIEGLRQHAAHAGPEQAARHGPAQTS
jgi:CheY-like chemotaxis protein/HPt (histidine-containing phosphotransfer) domain-containing protein